MDNNILIENRDDCAQKISEFRRAGNVDEAITLCLYATQMFSSDSFFYKILGDLYLQKNEYKKAALSYSDSLKYINDPAYFKTFVRFYRRISNRVMPDFLCWYQNYVWNIVQNGEISAEISDRIFKLWKECGFYPKPEIEAFASLTDTDKNFGKLQNETNRLITNKDLPSFFFLVQYRIESTILRNQTKHIDMLFAHTLEKLGYFQDAQILLEKIISNVDRCTPNMISAFFRVCRKQSDYTAIQKFFKIDNEFISKSDFNIQYELVYFFDFFHDMNGVKAVLKQMHASAQSSPPISRTLYNFYLQFNMFSEADAELSRLNTLLKSQKERRQKRRIEEQNESEKAIWKKLKDLVSEQEHNRQMIALKELLKGFSHELGQPITNIRYNTQLFQMRQKKGIWTEEDLKDLIQIVLNQTQRIGKLLDRFRPIVSSKSTNESFSVVDQVNGVFNNLSGRLKDAGITYQVSGDERITLLGDPVQFDQIFYNLILNAIQAISTDQNSGNISVSIKKNQKHKITIVVKDNGPGIPEETRGKIFEPFFSTKEPSSQSGGEGLGLFIVWNILKMFNGKISVDKHYTDGAKFNIVIWTEKEKDENE